MTDNKNKKDMEKKHKSSEEKVSDLIQEIREIGFEVEETEEGIRISE
ncbi:MAG: hypothetical protein P4L62_00475 [Candidatus Pacebacteria bacterium]|nr:hypothetical protein [Candidatus Paceibacterota bacterium]